jgi:biotin operon repressor
MDRLQRIYRLHHLSEDCRQPVPLRVLQDKFECSRATVNRIIQEMPFSSMHRLNMTDSATATITH